MHCSDSFIVTGNIICFLHLDALENLQDGGNTSDANFEKTYLCV